MKSKASILVAAVLSTLCLSLDALASSGAGAAADGYHLEHVVTVPGSSTGWDYIALDQQRQRVFIAHRKDGLQVYDIPSGAVIRTLADSEGANTSAIAAEFDLGIAGTTDGHIVVFELSTLKTIARYQSTTSGFDGATYDAVSKRFAIVGEADEAKGRTPVLFFDGRTGKPAGSVLLDSVKVDGPRADGAGNIFLPLRDKSMVVKVDARSLRPVGKIPLKGCVKPAALETDNASGRIFVGCRGDAKVAPALAVLDAASGKQVATLPIGHGVDDVFYDQRSGTILSANGDDASMTVIRRSPAGQYRVAATVGTRPRARTGVLDQATGKIYLVNAEYVDTYPEGRDIETRYFPNTFSILTYAQ
jgi:hypothetical protein